MATRSDPTFVFLISSGRSGSTLVYETLARHPDVGFITNLEDRFPWLPPRACRINSTAYRRLPRELSRKGVPRYGPSEGYRLLARRVSPMLSMSCRDLVASDAMPRVAERFRLFFAEQARIQGKPVFLHKFTGWPRSGFIRAVFPDARFIHVVRDPLDVVSSELRVPWWKGWLGPQHLTNGTLPPSYISEWKASGQSFPLLAGLSWKAKMDAYFAARELVPAGQWLDVRFEDVLDDPRSRFKEMVAFAGLDRREAFDVSVSGTDFRSDRHGVFRRDLDSSSIAMLEESLADHLRYWEYR